MKLYNPIKMIALAGLMATVLPMSAQAALTFGGWSVTTGAINSTCPGTTCNTLVTGDGFLQEQVTLNAVTYIHTVITDPNASGAASAVPYSDESYVVSGGNTVGIAAKQSMTDTSFNFSGSTTLYSGWAANGATNIKPGGDANLNIIQSFSDDGGAAFGDEFSSSFGLKINLAADGTQTGKSMSVGQILEMGNGVTANTTDIQRFVIEQRAGDMLASANTAGGFKLGNTSFSATDVPLNGTDNVGNVPDADLANPVTWQADDGNTVKGDDVMLVWLGQEVSDGTAGGGLSVFGYESVTVVGETTNASVTPDQFASNFSTEVTDPVLNNTNIGTINETTPFNWDAAFGTVPALPAPAVNNGTINTPNYVDSGACTSGTTLNTATGLCE
jgi:hypothetical protein